MLIPYPIVVPIKFEEKITVVNLNQFLKLVKQKPSTLEEFIHRVNEFINSVTNRYKLSIIHQSEA